MGVNRHSLHLNLLRHYISIACLFHLVYKYVTLRRRQSGNLTYRSESGISGPLFVVVEFAPHGNLRQFLRERRPSEYQHTRQSYSGPSLTMRDFVSFAFQIARGMEYLGTRKVRS